MTPIALTAATVAIAALICGEPALGEGDRFHSRGLSLRGGVGLSLCAGFDDNSADERPYGCESFSRGDLGLALSGYAGWRFLEWGTVELGYTHAFHEVDKEEGCGYITRRSDIWYAPRLGMRFHPLASRFRLEPVAGIHVGYVAMRRRFELVDVDPATCFEVRPYTAQLDGVQLDATVGLEIHLTAAVSIGLELTAFENLWVKDERGRAFDGDRDDFFFNIDLMLNALIG